MPIVANSKASAASPPYSMMLKRSGARRPPTICSIVWMLTSGSCGSTACTAAARLDRRILAVQEEAHESFVDHGDALGTHAITLVQRTALQHPDHDGLKVFGRHHLDPHAWP